MKKRIFVLGICLIVFVFAASLFAASADDYKVIKNAVKSQEASKAGLKSPQWFKVLVTGKGGDQEKVKITIPISLVELMLKACPEKKLHVDDGCQIDIQRVWNELKAAGPLALVEVEDQDETVKIWFE
jgi:hypothetical protein